MSVKKLKGNVVSNYRAQTLRLNGKSGIEGAPVKLLLEVLPETALTGLAMSGERQKIYLSICCQNQNHSLDDETFETFSYFCARIERRGDNRTYLVKWLKHFHNSLISNHKDTKFRPLGQIFMSFILLNFKESDVFYGIFSKVKFLTNY